VYRWALFFHLVGALLFFSGLAVAAVAQLSARRRRRPSEVALLLGAARTGVLLVALGTVLILAFGLWLADLSGYGLGGWVLAALVLFLLSVLLGGLGGQAPKRARLLAERLARAGDEASPELEALLANRRADALNAAAAVAAVAVLVLMVWKPGG
jgi:uncharacterized membrane protein